MELVQHLEHYPPSLLAALPPTLRRSLLLRLPIVDVCQLEKTVAFDGLDAESIWGELFELRYRRYKKYACIWHPYLVGKALQDLEAKDMPKREKFLAVVVTMIFGSVRPGSYLFLRKGHVHDPYVDPYLDDFVNYLVAAMKVEMFHDVTAEMTPIRLMYANNNFAKWGRAKSYEETFHRFQYVPPRFSHYVNAENHYRYVLSDVDAITLLMEKCDYYPDDVSIPLVAYPFQYPDDESRALKLVGKLLHKVRTLHLSSNYLLTQFCTTLRSGFATAGSSSVLASLHLSDVTDGTLSLFLSLSDSSPFPCVHYKKMQAQGVRPLNRVQTSCPYSASGNEPSLDGYCSTLRELSLSGSLTVNGFDKLSDTLDSLGKLTSFSLTHIVLKDKEPSQTPSSCVSAELAGRIALLLQRPYFQHLTLYGGNYPLESVQNIVTTFLTKPCTQLQTLEIKSVEMKASSAPRRANTRLRHVPDLAVEYKCLDVTRTEVPQDFAKWLFSLQPLKLKSLKIFIEDVAKSMDFLPLVTQNRSLQIENLSLGYTFTASAKHFQLLLQNRTLKRLQLKMQNFLNLADLTQGLIKQRKIGTLEELKITHSHCDAQGSASNFQLFSDTLFSLPQLEHLVLDIDMPWIARDAANIETIYKSWKMYSGGKRPKRLCFGQKLTLDEKHQSMMDEVGLHT